MRRLIAALALVLVLQPAVASALTVQDVVAMSNSGVSDELILALIERDMSIFTIDPADVASLRRQGVSERVVLAMLASGRQQPASPAQSTEPRASSPAPAPGPDVIVVGHGPDRPNTARELDFVVPAENVQIVAMPFYVPIPLSPCAIVSATPPAQAASTAGFGRFMNDPSARFVNDGSQRFLNDGFISAQQPLVSVSCAGPAPPSSGRSRHQRLRR